MHNWYVGQRIVSLYSGRLEDILDRPLAGLGCQTLEEGAIYTIRHILRCENMVGFWLEELRNPIGLGMEHESVYDESLFRPLEEEERSEEEMSYEQA